MSNKKGFAPDGRSPIGRKIILANMLQHVDKIQQTRSEVDSTLHPTSIGKKKPPLVDEYTEVKEAARRSNLVKSRIDTTQPATYNMKYNISRFNTANRSEQHDYAEHANRVQHMQRHSEEKERRKQEKERQKKEKKDRKKEEKRRKKMISQSRWKQKLIKQIEEKQLFEDEDLIKFLDKAVDDHDPLSKSRAKAVVKKMKIDLGLIEDDSYEEYTSDVSSVSSSESSDSYQQKKKTKPVPKSDPSQHKPKPVSKPKPKSQTKESIKSTKSETRSEPASPATPGSKQSHSKKQSEAESDFDQSRNEQKRNSTTEEDQVEQEDGYEDFDDIEEVEGTGTDYFGYENEGIHADENGEEVTEEEWNKRKDTITSQASKKTQPSTTTESAKQDENADVNEEYENEFDDGDDFEEAKEEQAEPAEEDQPEEDQPEEPENEENDQDNQETEDGLDVPPVDLPEDYRTTEAELFEQQKRWAKLVLFMQRKKHPYESKYADALEKLDAMGALNLQRLRKEQIPPVAINYCCALFINPYEGLAHTLDDGPINDALRMAELFIGRGFTVVYICDATPREYYRWMDWLLENVEKEFVSYFSGHGTQIPDTTGKEEDGLSEVMVFYSEQKKKEKRKEMFMKRMNEDSDFRAHVEEMKEKKEKERALMNASQRAEFHKKIHQQFEGVGDEMVEDTAMFELITGKDYAETRIVLITDCCHSGTMFNMDQMNEGHLNRPPLNVVCIGSALDSQTAKQTVLSGNETGVFTHNFTTLLKQKPETTFNELQTYMDSKIKKYQSIQLTGSSDSLYAEPILGLVPEDERLFTADSIPEDILNALEEDGFNTGNPTELPTEDKISEAERIAAEERWATFKEEMKKPANYSSKYKKQLQKLDSMGAINLERLKREQIPPNVTINKCCALFFNPYEDLPHTLDDGPVNDALAMSELFLKNDYFVCYICDATPMEYYKWMDWLLENVELELVSYFSGHGTQVPDTTGLEEDGLSEVMVFYDATRKNSTEKRQLSKKVKSESGEIQVPVGKITNELVEDTAMYDLITVKDYEQTRIVMITDCCHSGTMFNLDLYDAPATSETGKVNKPPLRCICIGSALDSQTAKQTVLSGNETGVFTHNFTTLLKQKPETTFSELQTYMDSKIKKYQSIQLTASDDKLLADPILG
ncbi:putative metacaspase-1 [Blattamonas nauphoetae]|uniref:Metacaspase-1 n=1 Tax=Blattamonas nauphoetae TaxID=2049346 RepID=A0ABQ9WTH8_9EUKA|nr:putative metacaspase-1 [Blattamonas nauphoetae]